MTRDELEPIDLAASSPCLKSCLSDYLVPTFCATKSGSSLMSLLPIIIVGTRGFASPQKPEHNSRCHSESDPIDQHQPRNFAWEQLTTANAVNLPQRVPAIRHHKNAEYAPKHSEDGWLTAVSSRR
jgi:hypothetical protein